MGSHITDVKVVKVADVKAIVEAISFSLTPENDLAELPFENKQ